MSMNGGGSVGELIADGLLDGQVSEGK